MIELGSKNDCNFDLLADELQTEEATEADEKSYNNVQIHLFFLGIMTWIYSLGFYRIKSLNLY